MANLVIYQLNTIQGALYGVIISMVVICLIITNTQVAIANDLLHYEAIPTSIDGCTNETMVKANLMTASSIKQADDGFAFYKISFMVSD